MADEPDGVIDFGATPSTTTTASGNLNIDGILIGTQWVDFELTYSFPSISADYGAGYVDSLPSGFSALDTKQEDAVEAWLGMFADVSGLSFVELDGLPGALDEDQEATLKFANSTVVGTARVADFPDNAEEGGDVWFGGTGDDPDFGDFDWATVGHEIGHAVGLAHGHNIGGGLGELPANVDSSEYSIMTYSNYIGENAGFNTNAFWHNPQSLMMLDIQALQYIYGANFSTNSTGSTYTFDTTTGEMSINGVGQGASGANIVFRTVWDGNGVDTYDLSNYTTNLSIDLRPGEFSDFDVGGNFQRADLGFGDPAAGPGVEMSRGHLFNALQFGTDTRSLIENAVAGTGDDTIHGNEANNVLYGGAGDDDIYGYGGADVLYGGLDDDDLFGGDGGDDFYGGGGIDNHYGGGGNDDFFLTAAEANGGFLGIYGGDIADLDEILLNGGGTFDLLGLNVSNIDEIRFNSSSDQTVILSTKEMDSSSELQTVTIDGFTGSSADTVIVQVDNTFNNFADLSTWVFQDWQAADSVSIIGDTGADTLTGSNQDDHIFGGDPSGSGAVDILYGGDGDDLLDGGLFRDQSYGGAGNDTFQISAGNAADDVFGGIGTDILDFSATSFIGNITFTSSASGTYQLSSTVYNFTSIDVILGNNQDNTWDMYFSTQSVVAGSGDDTFIHGAGEFLDNLDAGGGIDTFDASAESVTGITADMAAGTIFGLNGSAGSPLTFQNFENVIGTQAADSITGSSGSNTIEGNGGNDSINAGGGNDIIYGGDDDDTIHDTSGDNTVYGDGGNDTITRGGGGTLGDAYYGGTGTDTWTIASGGLASSVLIDMQNNGLFLSGSLYEIWDSFENYDSSATTGGEDVFGTTGANEIRTGSGDNSIDGNGGADSVFAGGGDDTIIANGNVTIDAGAGDDLVDWNGGITESVDGGAGNDTVDHSNFSWSSTTIWDLEAGTRVVGGFTGDWLNFEHSINTNGADNSTVLGTSGTNTITAGGGNNSIDGRGGDDTLSGNAGNDTIDGGLGDDVIYGGADDDDLSGGDALFSGTDAIYAGDGNDTVKNYDALVGDYMDGGAGIDTLDHSGIGVFSGTIVDLTAGTVTFTTFPGNASNDTAVNFENFIGDDTYGEEVTGTTGANSISTGGGNDTIFGNGTGALESGDQLYGGDGDDDIFANGGYVDAGIGNDYVRTANTAVEEYYGGAGIDTLDTSLFNGSYTVDLGAGTTNFGETFAQFENYIGGNGNHSLTGTTGANELTTGTGADSIDGLAGDDTIMASGGNDTINGGNGTDTVFGGDGDDTVDGGLFNDVIYGGDGNDLIQIVGGDAADDVFGGADVDTLDMSAVTTALGVEADLAGQFYNYGAGSPHSLVGVENVVGTDNSDTITGDSGANSLEGGAGNDTLDGGAGADSIDGGAGIDTLTYASSSTGVRVDIRNATAEQFGDAEGDVLSGIENFVGSDFDDFFAVSNTTSVENTMTGGAGNDILSAFSGNDTLFGGVGEDRLRGGDGIDVLYGGDDDDRVEGNAGNDIMYGGDGDDIMTGGNDDDQMFGGADNDTYVIKQAGDTVIEFVGEGIDLVRSSRDYVLGANVENLLLTGTTADEGTGNALDNILDAGSKGATLTGLGGDDTLLGSNNADTLDGGTGNDDLVGNDANDRLYGGDGNDTLDGGDDNDRLEGDAGNDTLEGGNGTDVLIGGADQDFYYGGAGADRFRFDDGHFAGTGGGTADRIFDFSQLDGDTIQLSQVDAIVGGGDDAFTFIGMSGFSNTAGELRYTQSLGNTFVRGDTDGDGAQDFVIRVDGTVNFIGADFFL